MSTEFRAQLAQNAAVNKFYLYRDYTISPEDRPGRKMLAIAWA